MKKTMKKQKKAAIDVSFNWIFVLIAGAAILIFFIALVNNQKDKAEINSAITIKTELTSIFVGASSSKDRQLEIDIPNINLKLTCDFATCETFGDSANPSCYSQYEIGKTGVNQQTPSQIMFSPNLLLGRKLFAWTLPWNVPFYVTNFLYLAGTNSKYIFVDEGNALEFFNEFPEKTNKKLISISNLETESDEGNEIFKFIFFETEPSEIIISQDILNAAKSQDISAIKINPSTKQITFYYLEDETFILSTTTRYISNAEVYAAIFSQSFDFYQCNMQKAFNRLHAVSSVLERRSQLLFEDNQTRTSCLILYDTSVNGLSDIKETSKFIVSNQNINTLNNAIHILQTADHSAKEKSCPSIY